MTHQTPLPTIFFTQTAIDLIIEQSMKYNNQRRQDDHETGGIMIGKRLAKNRIVIVAATGPGPNAHHHQYEFGLDADYANAELQRWIQRDSTLDFIGIWHKHPPTLDRPSTGDIQSAHQLFREPSYTTNEIVNPITLVRRGQLEVRCFYMSREEARRQADFRFVQHSICPDHDPIVHEPVSQLVVASDREPWHRRNADRFATEQQRLNHMNVTFQVADVEDAKTIFIVQHPQVTIYLETRDAYPELPPTVYVEIDGQEIHPPLQRLAMWNKNMFLDLIVQDIDFMIRSEELAVPDGLAPPPIRSVAGASTSMEAHPLPSRPVIAPHNDDQSLASSARVDWINDPKFYLSLVLVVTLLVVLVLVIKHPSRGGGVAGQTSPATPPPSLGAPRSSPRPEQSPVPSSSVLTGLDSPGTGSTGGMPNPTSRVLPSSIPQQSPHEYTLKWEPVLQNQMAEFINLGGTEKWNVVILAEDPLLQANIQIKGRSSFITYNQKTTQAEVLQRGTTSMRLFAADKITILSEAQLIEVEDGRKYWLTITRNQAGKPRQTR